MGTDASASMPYDKLWAERLPLLQGIIADGESLRSRVINLLERAIERTLAQPKYHAADRMIELPPTPFGQPFCVPIGLANDLVISPGFLRGSLAAYWVARTIEQEPFEHICELGAGWGGNLFDLFELGLPREITLHAGEYTAAGVAMIDTLAGLEPRLAIDTFRMDFTDPNASEWPVPKEGRTLFFTCHAIEQVSRIGPGFFRDLAKAYPRSAVLHFEPIGHQIPEHRGGFRMQRQLEFFTRMNWNMDLYEVLGRLHSSGEIRVEYLFPNYFGRDAQNLCSILRWEPVR